MEAISKVKEYIKSIFPEDDSIKCVCGGEMKMKKRAGAIYPRSSGVYECEECGSESDGAVFEPSKELKEKEEYEEWIENFD